MNSTVAVPELGSSKNLISRTTPHSAKKRLRSASVVPGASGVMRTVEFSRSRLSSGLAASVAVAAAAGSCSVFARLPARSSAPTGSSDPAARFRPVDAPAAGASTSIGAAVEGASAACAAAAACASAYSFCRRIAIALMYLRIRSMASSIDCRSPYWCSNVSQASRRYSG